MKLTQEELKSFITYDKDTGILTWDKHGHGVPYGKEAGSENNLGYRCVTICGKVYLSHRLAWLYVYGYVPESNIDHIDRNPSNNNIANLREVSQTCNMRNRKQNKNNKSGVKGVSWHKVLDKWHSTIRANGRNIYLGYHVDFTEAVCHRLAAEQAENWAGCDSSSPAYVYVKSYINHQNE